MLIILRIQIINGSRLQFSVNLSFNLLFLEGFDIIYFQFKKETFLNKSQLKYKK